MEEKNNTVAVDAQKIMSGVLLHFARVMKGTDYGDDDKTRGAMADKGEKYLLNNPAFAVKLYDDYIAGLKTPSVVNGDNNKGAEMMRQQIDRLQAERDIIYDAWQGKIKDKPVDAPREDSGEEDSNKSWYVEDMDGNEFYVSLTDDFTLDIRVAEYGREGNAYVIWVVDAVKQEPIPLAVYFNREQAEKSADNIEEIGELYPHPDFELTAIELLKRTGGLNPKKARMFKDKTALEYLNTPIRDVAGITYGKAGIMFSKDEELRKYLKRR